MLTSHLFTQAHRRALTGSVVALDAATGVATGSGAAAQAAVPPRSTFRNLATGFVLDSNTAGQVYTSTANGGAYQKWLIAGSDFGSSTVRNVATGRCLDSSSTRVYTSWCNGGSFQKWFVQERGFGAVVLRNLATGYVLDSNAARSVYALPENGGSYQKWLGLPA